jgi:hypothetical protein
MLNSSNHPRGKTTLSFYCVYQKWCYKIVVMWGCSPWMGQNMKGVSLTQVRFTYWLCNKYIFLMLLVLISFLLSATCNFLSFFKILTFVPNCIFFFFKTKCLTNKGFRTKTVPGLTFLPHLPHLFLSIIFH